MAKEGTERELLSKITKFIVELWRVGVVWSPDVK